jgi:hypothetical protein
LPLGGRQRLPIPSSENARHIDRTWALDTRSGSYGDRGMTSLEIAAVILKILTLIGLIGIAAGAMHSYFGGEDSFLYATLGFTAMSGALWIIVTMLLQP